MKFPVQRGKSKEGLEAQPGTCPVCGGPLSAEPGGFAFINGGALRKIDKDTAVPAADLIGFLSVGFHGGHSGIEQVPSASMYVADDVPTGQFEFYFCSTECLRGFFNQCVDALEQTIEMKNGR
jgi:hypothetical protein